MYEENEINLIKQAKQGNEDAISTLFGHYKSLVNKITRQYFLVGADEEDLIQEGMIGLYKALLCFNEENMVSFKCFAKLCITRQIQSAIKSANRFKNKVLNDSVSFYTFYYDENDDDLNILNFVPSSTPSPDEIVVQQENINQIQKEVNEKLSLLEKKIFSLYLAGKSYVEIAEQLTKPKKVIDNALVRVKQKLNHLKNL